MFSPLHRPQNNGVGCVNSHSHARCQFGSGARFCRNASVQSSTSKPRPELSHDMYTSKVKGEFSQLTPDKT